MLLPKIVPWSMELEEEHTLEPWEPGEVRRYYSFRQGTLRWAILYWGQKVFELKTGNPRSLDLALVDGKHPLFALLEAMNNAEYARAQSRALGHEHVWVDHLHTCNCEQRGWLAALEAMKRG